MATGVPAESSAASKYRPSRRGIPIARKYPGSMSYQRATGVSAAPSSSVPGTRKAIVSRPPNRGPAEAVPVATTDGSAISSAEISSNDATTSWPVSYFPSDARDQNVTRRSRSKPGSQAATSRNARPSRPAPTRRTRPSATSPVTRAARAPRRIRPPLSGPVRSEDTRFGLDARSAGRTPNRSVANAAVAAVNRTAGPSTLTAPTRGIPPGARATNVRTDQTASRRPRVAPAAASSRPSARSIRARRPAPAPNERRTANSLSRRADRAIRRLATLAHPIRSTNPTAPMNTLRARRDPPTTASWSELPRRPHPAFVSGYSSARSAATARRSATPSSTDTTGRSRPIALKPRHSRFEGSS